jgi:methylglutaconyl-CoA hydratase
MLTGERITAREAARIGLVHEVVALDELDAAVEKVLSQLLTGGPAAIAAAKRLVHDLSGRAISPELIDETARRIAALRVSPEAREGVSAFLEKRKPGWIG